MGPHWSTAERAMPLENGEQGTCAKKGLKNLSPDEKNMLAIYLLAKTKSLAFTASGATVSLEATKIIYVAGRMPQPYYGIVYNLMPWAWDELNQHPEYLEPALTELTETPGLYEQLITDLGIRGLTKRPSTQI
jgi:hypothetical protein